MQLQNLNRIVANLKEDVKDQSVLIFKEVKACSTRI